MDESFAQGKDLLDVEDVAWYLGVGGATVWRWCRDGSLPCLKIGKSWRIRRAALEQFLSQSERPVTLVGQLRSFLAVPDNLIGIAQNFKLLRRLDSAFFRVGEAQAGLLVKFHDEEAESADELRTDLEGDGLEVGRWEKEGRFRFLAESGPPTERVNRLRQLLSEEEADRKRIVWVSFDWVKEVDLDEALHQQKELTELVEDHRIVVKTAVLEQVLDEWPLAERRQAHTLHSGIIWISEAGLALSRVTPLPPD
jgi:excisionase family DNA binding protein